MAMPQVTLGPPDRRTEFPTRGPVTAGPFISPTSLSAKLAVAPWHPLGLQVTLISMIRSAMGSVAIRRACARWRLAVLSRGGVGDAVAPNRRRVNLREGIPPGVGDPNPGNVDPLAAGTHSYVRVASPSLPERPSSWG